MHRKIKFRGKVIDAKDKNRIGTWAYGLLARAELKDDYGPIFPYIIQEEYGDNYKDFEININTVSQYTGVKDKNGRELFEGDIIKHQRVIEFPDDYHSDEPTKPSVEILRIGICYINSLNGVIFKGLKTVKDSYDDKIILFNGIKQENIKWKGKLTCINNYGEIIGNIYENPELLEDKNGSSYRDKNNYRKRNKV